MRKRQTKAIVFILVMALILSLVPVETFAFTSYTQKYQKTSYIQKPVYYAAIGDSIAAGYGLGGNNLKHLLTDTDFLNKVVHNSLETCYPRLVANRIAKVTTGKDLAGDDEFANLGAPGYTVQDFLYILTHDPEEVKDYVNPFWQNAGLLSINNTGGASDHYWAETILKEIKKADIITFNAGGNDVMQPMWDLFMNNENPLIMILGNLLKLATLEYSLKSIDLESILYIIVTSSKNLKDFDISKIDLSSIKSSLGDSKIDFKIDADTIRECIEFLDTDNISSIMLETVKNMSSDYGKTIDALQAYNPDAKIILVGSHDPYGSSTLYKGVRYTPAEIITRLCEVLSSSNKHIDKDLIEGLEFTILYNLLGKSANDAINLLNETIEDAAIERGLPFVYTMDRVDSDARIAVHPKANQHEQIADAITEVLIPQISCDTNGYKPFGKDIPAQTIYGTTISFTVPPGVKFITVNDRQIWNNTMKTRTASFEAKDPKILVYAHYDNNVSVFGQKWNSPGLTTLQSLFLLKNTLFMGKTGISSGKNLLICQPEEAFNGIDASKILNKLRKTGYTSVFNKQSTVQYNSNKMEEFTNIYGAKLAAADSMVLELDVEDFWADLLTRVYEMAGIELGAGGVLSEYAALHALASGDIDSLIRQIELRGKTSRLKIDTDVLNNLSSREPLRHLLNSCLADYEWSLINCVASLDKALPSGSQKIAVEINSGIAGFNGKGTSGKLMKDTLNELQQFNKSLMKAYGWGYIAE